MQLVSPRTNTASVWFFSKIESNPDIILPIVEHGVLEAAFKK